MKTPFHTDCSLSEGGILNYSISESSKLSSSDEETVSPAEGWINFAINTEYFWEVYIEEIPIPNTRNWGHNCTHNQTRQRVGTVIYSGNFTIWTQVIVLVILSVWFRDLVPCRPEPAKQAVKTFVNFPDRCSKDHSHSQTERGEGGGWGRSRWAAAHHHTQFAGNSLSCRCRNLNEQVQSHCRCISPPREILQYISLRVGLKLSDNTTSWVPSVNCCLSFRFFCSHLEKRHCRFLRFVCLWVLLEWSMMVWCQIVTFVPNRGAPAKQMQVISCFCVTLENLLAALHAFWSYVQVLLILCYSWR